MNPDITIREKVVSWLANQGATTVLLFTGLWIGYAKAEVIIDRIEAGYARNARDLMSVAKQRDETLERLISQWKEDRTLLVEILRGKHPPEAVTGESH